MKKRVIAIEKGKIIRDREGIYVIDNISGVDSAVESKEVDALE